MHIYSPSGELELEGVLESSGNSFAILCHPHPSFGGNMDNNVIIALASVLSKKHSVLRFNFRGVGASEGSFAHGVGERDDVRAAVDYVMSCGAKKIAVVGYSFGSWVALTSCANDERVAALIGISPPVTMFDFSILKGCDKHKFFVVGDRDVVAPLRKFQDFYDVLEEPKEFVVLHGDHIWIGTEHEVASSVAEYLERISTKSIF